MTNPFNRKQLLFVTILPSILSFSPPAAFAAAPRILVVHSCHQDRQEHGVEMTKGIEEALAGADCDLRYSRMDIKRHDSEAWKRADVVVR